MSELSQTYWFFRYFLFFRFNRIVSIQIESAVAAERHQDEKRKGKKGRGSQSHAEPNPKYEIRKVKEAYVKTRLHMCSGHIPSHIADARCVYFLRCQTGIRASSSVDNRVDSHYLSCRTFLFRKSIHLARPFYLAGVIPTFASLQEANELMPTFLDFGVLNGHALLMLEQLLGHVFMPLFSHHAQVCWHHAYPLQRMWSDFTQLQTLIFSLSPPPHGFHSFKEKRLGGSTSAEPDVREASPRQHQRTLSPHDTLGVVGWRRRVLGRRRRGGVDGAGIQKQSYAERRVRRQHAEVPHLRHENDPAD